MRQQLEEVQPGVFSPTSTNLFGKPQPILAIDLLMMGLSTIGLALNLILLYITLVRRQSRWNIDSTLLTIVALFDSLMSSFVLVGILVRLGASDVTSVLSVDSWWCISSTVLFCGSTVITVVFTSILSLVRYMVIVRGYRLNARYWTVGSLLILGVFLGMFMASTRSPDRVILPSGLYCTPRFWGDKLKVRLFGITILFSLLSSIILIPFCYSGVTLHYHHLMSKMVDAKPFHTMSSPTSRRRRRCNLQLFVHPTTFQLTLVILAYAIALLPETILVCLTLRQLAKRSPLADGLVIAMMFSITIINALFALLLHEETKREFLYLLGWRSYRLRPINLQDRRPSDATS